MWYEDDICSLEWHHLVEVHKTNNDRMEKFIYIWNFSYNRFSNNMREKWKIFFNKKQILLYHKHQTSNHLIKFLINVDLI